LPPQTTPPLFAETETSEPEPKLDAMSAFEQVVADYGSVGLSLRDHPVRFLRPLLEQRSVVPASELTALGTGRWVTVAGLVLLRQRPSTAKGITFVTLEDETGVANLIVRPDVWERYHRAAKSATVMLAHGRLQNEAGVIHVLVAKLEDLSRMLSTVEARSRDFR
jgi:error-prone DNA polymerase